METHMHSRVFWMSKKECHVIFNVLMFHILRGWVDQLMGRYYGGGTGSRPHFLGKNVTCPPQYIIINTNVSFDVI